LSRSLNLKCRLWPLLLLWIAIVPWFLYSYFLGENSVRELRQLKETEKRLKKEVSYWELQNEILKEKLTALKENSSFYYEKLAREMLVKGKKGEEVILFVK